MASLNVITSTKKKKKPKIILKRFLTPLYSSYDEKSNYDSIIHRAKKQRHTKNKNKINKQYPQDSHEHFSGHSFRHKMINNSEL